MIYFNYIHKLHYIKWLRFPKPRKGSLEGQDDVDDGLLESDHDEDDEVDEKKRKVSKVWYFDKKIWNGIRVQILLKSKNKEKAWNIKVEA